MHVTTHPFNISQIGESQREGGCPHGPSIAKRASTIELGPSWLVHITEPGGGQLLQHLDHPSTITATGRCTVLLRKPREAARHQGCACVHFTIFTCNKSAECIHVPASHVLLVKAGTGE